jgi:hypothetical protein
MNNTELTSLVKEYIANIELMNRKNIKIDIFPLEDTLNRELSINLFDVSLNEKTNFILNQQRISEMLVNG